MDGKSYKESVDYGTPNLHESIGSSNQIHDTFPSHSRAATVEGLAIQNMRRRTIKMELKGQTIEITWEQKMQMYQSFIRQFKQSAVEFLIFRLIRQLQLFACIWPGDINDIPHKLFHWSVDFFLQRISISQLYLDVILMERSQADLDCLKYRTDIFEITNIIRSVSDDFCNERDICLGAISMIHGANYHINSKWVNEVKESRQIQENLVKTVIANRRLSTGSNEKFGRFSALVIEEDIQNAKSPIELRYHINWVRTGVEQFMLKIHQRDGTLESQLADRVKKLSQDSVVYHYKNLVYLYQIKHYRNEIEEWQKRYDNDYDNVDLQCTQTLLTLQKMKEEYKFYSDQLIIMKERIAEVTEIIRLEKEHHEKEERDAILQNIEKNKALEMKKKKMKDNKKKSGKK